MNDEELKEEILGEKTQETKKDEKRKKKRRHKGLIITIIFIIIMLLIASTIFAILNLNKTTILQGILINNINVEGLTEEEAIEMLTQKIEENNKQEILLKVSDVQCSIIPEQIDVQYNIEEAVKEAYSIGRSGNLFQNNFTILKTFFYENNIELEMTYDEDVLIQFLEDISKKIPDSMADNTYCVEENQLIITRGTSGEVVNIEESIDLIIDAIKNKKKETIRLTTIYQECPSIDIEQIYAEVKCEPQNASYKKDPFEIIPHKNGIDFDLDEAKKIIAEEQEEYVIELETIEPDILTNEIGEEAFPDLISSFSTKYDETNVSRSNNLKIAMSKLNGVVIMPDEVFSFNGTLGKRTAADGYEYANGFAGGKVVPMLAGGICQIASTLYDAALYANLNIVERHNHMFQATYVDPGKDATVVYGSLDLKFENTRQYPIMLKTSCSGGLAEIKIFGMKENIEYEIEIITNVLGYTPYSVVYQNDSSLSAGQEAVAQYGLQGCNSTTYRILKLNGQEVSKELLSSDSYSALNKIVRRGVVEETLSVSEADDNTANNTTETTTTEQTNQEENKIETETVEENLNNEVTTQQNQETNENQNLTEN